jgi:putative DNA primase/helicase
MTSKLKFILAMVKRDCAVFPVVEGGKKPAVKMGVKAASKNRNMIKKHFSANPNLNYAVAMGSPSKIFAVDLDGPEGVANFRQLETAYGRSARTVTVRTPNGWHLYFRAPKYRIPNSVSGIANHIDIRGDGGYVVGPGSRTPDGVYRFASGRSLADVEIAQAPAWLLKMIVPPVSPANESAKPAEISKIDRERAVTYADAARQREVDRLSKAPQHQRNHTLNRCAFKLGQFLPYGLLDRQSVAEQLAPVALKIGLDEAEIRPTIESGLTAGSRHPRQLPFLKNSAQRSPAATSSKRPNDNVTEQLAKLGETDTDNAQRFATRFGHKVIFTSGRGWLVFDGIRFKPEATVECMELAKKTARLINDEVALQRGEKARLARSDFAKQSLSKGSLERMIDLAKGLLAVEDSKLDSDPMLLNTETGTIDLRTGQLERHDRRDLLTKLAPVAADQDAICPQFKTFLRQVTGGDKDLIHYIQKCVGYTLTGDTSEQVLFFVYGPGNTGKSTLVNLIRKLVGDYGCHTPTETLLVKQYDNAIPADLARMAGARMVTAIEANFNRHLDEARIKAMTGGEPITARYMRQNFFEFTPSHKLWLVANDRPRVRSTDTALWRRIRVLPFSVEIPKSNCDPDLSEKLKAEWPGILAWAVRGCLKWQAERLIEPACVQTATADWQNQVDHLKRFVEETIIFSPEHEVQARSMYESYSRWCSQNGERRLSMAHFKSRLSETFDLAQTKINGRGWWKGVKLKV